MFSSQYVMPTTWRVKGDIQDVYEICTQSLEYPRWWPSVYLEVKVGGRDSDTGRDFYTVISKGRLPYKLKWNCHFVHEDAPGTYSVRASGDLTGKGTWTFRQDGEYVNVQFDWVVYADKPLLKYLSPILNPLFRANHYWAMNRGLESIHLELLRRKVKAVRE